MKRSILGYIGISFVGGLLGRGFQYLLSLIIARGLGAGALGVFSIGLVILRLSSAFSILGLDTAAQKFIPIYKNKDRDSLTGFVVLSILSPVVFGSLSAGILYLIFTSTKLFPAETERVISIFLIAIPFLALLKTGQESLQGFSRADYGTLIKDILQSGLAVLFVLIAVYHFGSLTFAIVGFTLAVAIASLAGAVLVVKLGKSSALRESNIEYKRIYTYSLPILVSSIGYPLIMWSDILVLGHFSSSTEVGHYRGAYIIASLVPFILFAINTVFPPLASKFYNNNDQDQLKSLYSTITKWLVAIVFLEILFIYSFPNEILSMFGESFIESVDYLYLLAFAQGLATVVGPVGFLLTMTKFERVEAINMGMAAVLNVVLNILLVSRYGPLGAAVATTITICLLNITRVVEVWKLLGILPYSRTAIRGLVPAVVLAPILFFISQRPLAPVYTLLSGGIASAIAFLLSAYLFIYRPSDRLLLEGI
jgi:O-antigen/teichoic acid export membrane protein